MLRTASSLPLTGLSTLGSGPARFQTEPPACYRASWQLPGPDFHRQATTSLRTARSAATSQRHLPLCWAHERSWLAFCLAYTDMKWPSAAPKKRDALTDALSTLNPAITTEPAPDGICPSTLREALRH